MDKKGMELPQNVIVIAIIVLIVLVVVIALFAGGTGTIFSRFQDLFSKGVDDESTAISFCQQYCDLAMDKPQDLQLNTNYCKKWFKLDRQPPDGKPDKNTEGQFIRYYCSDKHEGNDLADSRGVGINCDVQCS